MGRIDFAITGNTPPNFLFFLFFFFSGALGRKVRLCGI